MDLRNSDEPMRLSRTSNRRVSKLPVSSPKTAWYSVVDRLGFEGWPPQGPVYLLVTASERFVAATTHYQLWSISLPDELLQVLSAELDAAAPA